MRQHQHHTHGLLSKVSGEQLNLTFEDNNIGRSALEGWIQLDVAEQLFATMGTNYAEMKAKALSKDFQPVPMEGMQLSATMVNELRTSDSHNVVGYVEGSEMPNEYVLIMGHWDHMGVNPTLEGDQIFNGAVDNATGTAAVMHMAETFSKRQPKRSVVFIGLTAEESGLLGSAYLVENAPFEYGNVIGGLNLDAFPAIGKSKDITIIGFGASELEPILSKHASEEGKYLAPDKSPEAGFFYRSDHINFAKRGIPMIYADPGIDLVDGGLEKGIAAARNYTANDYHKPSDEVRDDWDWSGIEQDLDIFTNFIDDLANSGEYPNWYEGNEFKALRDATRD